MMTNMYGGGSPWFNEMNGGGNVGGAWSPSAGYYGGGQPPQWGGGYMSGGGDGRAYAGGSSTFDEAGNSGANTPWGSPMAQPGMLGGAQQRRPDQMMPRQFGGGGGFQSLANALRMYGGRMGLMNGAGGGGMSGVGTKPMMASPGAGGDVMGGVMPTQGASMPPRDAPGTMPQAPAAPQGMPGMSSDNFGSPGQSGNSQEAIGQAMATGNQAGLVGAGSGATNSDINNSFYQQGVATPWYQQHQEQLNRQGPNYQPGGMFYR